MFDWPWTTIIAVGTTIGGYLLGFLLIPRIILGRREAGATLAWILAILFLPYLGALLFFLIGRTRVRRRTKKKRIRNDAFLRSLEQLPESPTACPPVNDLLPEPEAAARDITVLASTVSQSPPMPGNEVQVFIDANQAYNSMENAIRNAQHHVHLQSYIYRTDAAGLRFRDLLIEKAKQGLECRLLVDGVGGHQINKQFLKPLLDAGAQFARFMPVFKLSPHWRPNLRNHRKILVVDGVQGYCGGLNIGEEYQGRRKKFAPWRDTHLRLRGPVVRQLQGVFSEDWHYASGEDLADEQHFPLMAPCGSQLVQVVDSGPDNEHESIYSVFFTAVTEANDSIFITTPYFVPDAPMRMALKAAAWKGVDVRLLLPGKSDLRLVQLAGRSYYKELLEAGVRIYEHHPGILHAKTMVIDSIWATVGSANMDIRSFRLNFEANILISGGDFAKTMQRIFHDDLKNARELTTEILSSKRWGTRLAEALARILSPVL